MFFFLKPVFAFNLEIRSFTMHNVVTYRELAAAIWASNNELTRVNSRYLQRIKQKSYAIFVK